MLVQEQLKAEIASLQTWLEECDKDGDGQNADVVMEVEFACKQSTLLLHEFDEAVQQYQVTCSILSLSCRNAERNFCLSSWRSAQAKPCCLRMWPSSNSLVSSCLRTALICARCPNAATSTASRATVRALDILRTASDLRLSNLGEKQTTA